MMDCFQYHIHHNGHLLHWPGRLAGAMGACFEIQIYREIQNQEEERANESTDG